VRKELEEQLGERDPGLADLRSLDVLQRVIAESMRLYPPTWIYIRIAQEHDTLPSGTAIKPGTKLYLSPWVCHRNPRWFPDPERFDPDRFTAAAIQGRPRYVYFPFGGGQRVCIGRALAQMELPLILARIIRRFEISPPPEPVIPDPHITLTPRDGLRMRLRRICGP
jgi:cytochrome P450